MSPCRGGIREVLVPSKHLLAVPTDLITSDKRSWILVVDDQHRSGNERIMVVRIGPDLIHATWLPLKLRLISMVQNGSPTSCIHLEHQSRSWFQTGS